MRFSAVAVGLSALAAPALAAWNDVNQILGNWAETDEKTAAWYEEHGEPLPELAPVIATIERSRSYAVKLNCVGCPYRLGRKVYLDDRRGLQWQNPPQDSSLLFNFTIDDRVPALLLNGRQFAPLGGLTHGMIASQTPANLTQEDMAMIVKYRMVGLREWDWPMMTKYGFFELQYTHTLVGTKRPGRTWVQFDLTAIHKRDTVRKTTAAHKEEWQQRVDSYSLDKEGQQIVQLLLHQVEDTLSIEDIQVVERKDRVMPDKMPCGRLAMVQTEYNPLEWDRHGKIGTWPHTWNSTVERGRYFVHRNGGWLVMLAILGSYGIIYLIAKRSSSKDLGERCACRKWKAAAEARSDTEKLG